MLAEPDLFSDVNPKHSSLYHLCERRTSSLDCEAGDPSDDKDYLQNFDAVKHQNESEGSDLDVHNIKLMSHQHKFIVSSVLSKDNVINNNVNTKATDPHERLTRRWYLMVIVLLYVALVTSFCLNVNLLLKRYPQHSSSTQFAREEVSQLYEGN